MLISTWNRSYPQAHSQLFNVVVYNTENLGIGLGIRLTWNHNHSHDSQWPNIPPTYQVAIVWANSKTSRLTAGIWKLFGNFLPKEAHYFFPYLLSIVSQVSVIGTVLPLANACNIQMCQPQNFVIDQPKYDNFCQPMSWWSWTKQRNSAEG